MFWMHRRTRLSQVFTAILAFTGIVFATHSPASSLSLAAAEDLALSSDPGIQSVRASQQALDELSVAAEQLPDPLLKMGLVSLPMDTFNLGQEAMTQVQLGLVQKFPRGNSRALRSEQFGLKSQGLDKMAQDKALQVLLAVREQFLEVAKHRKLAHINAEAMTAFADVADITQDYYATGRVQQQDVLQAAVELAKVEDRATRIAQDEQQARARLAMWIGEAAYRDLEETWTLMDSGLSADAIKDNLLAHPRVQALQKHISAAETGVNLAKQKYKPEFALDVTYGGRGGTNPDGSARTDLMTFMVLMDVPLFHKNRQDRVVAAQLAESSAAMYNRDDLLRRMSSEVDFHFSTWLKQQERIKLFENSLLPEAAFSSSASFDAYQSSVTDLTTLLRTRITEFDLQLEHARLQAEMLKTRARLRYLEGE
ncbi:MAG: TolC family protein [Xanthomonadales bacterium]|jgi:outer membrane protein TolC|nr:TolC family protein [Xanthomonadales bacterium]